MAPEPRNMWGDKPYHSLNYALRERFGGKVYKLALDIGCTCPNRDGTLGYGGCVFCAEGGNSDFATANASASEGLTETVNVRSAEGAKPRMIADPVDITDRIERAKMRVESKMRGEQSSHRYIAYFQTYTNTYGDIDKIGACFEAAIRHPDIVGISVGTRPDCLDDEWVDLLAGLNTIKPVWVELGLQTVSDETAAVINRGYELPVFEDAYRRLKAAGLEVVVHMILGLPGENVENMRAGVEYLSHLEPRLDGIKLQMMHVLRGTKLAQMYEDDPSVIMQFSPEEYVDLVADLVEMLPPGVVVHRITGDGAKRLLIAPMWSADKKRVLNLMTKRFRERGAYQGARYSERT